MNKLNTRIRLRNYIGKIANELCPMLRQFFAKYVGKQVLTANGDLMKRIADAMPELPNSFELRVMRERSDYALRFSVRAAESAEDFGTTYQECSFYVGSVRDGVLESVEEKFDPHRTDWTSAEILAARQEVEKAEKALSAARSNLGPFGEYD